jgi:hypothetical protein
MMEALHWDIVKYVDAYSATLKTGTINHYHCSIPSSLAQVTYPSITPRSLINSGARWRTRDGGGACQHRRFGGELDSESVSNPNSLLISTIVSTGFLVVSNCELFMTEGPEPSGFSCRDSRMPQVKGVEAEYKLPEHYAPVSLVVTNMVKEPAKQEMAKTVGMERLVSSVIHSALLCGVVLFNTLGTAI